MSSKELSVVKSRCGSEPAPVALAQRLSSSTSSDSLADSRPRSQSQPSSIVTKILSDCSKWCYEKVTNTDGKNKPSGTVQHERRRSSIKKQRSTSLSRGESADRATNLLSGMRYTLKRQHENPAEIRLHLTEMFCLRDTSTSKDNIHRSETVSKQCFIRCLNDMKVNVSKADLEVLLDIYTDPDSERIQYIRFINTMCVGSCKPPQQRSALYSNSETLPPIML
mmetsp:Transcript_24454/g.24702  ORF Transcript_24454/g.24702 Transcript_24454/m.24702 type:complete len:223 (-) Transcript_24454:353-1021(-)